ncbi:MAG TPA: hypothetical protein VFP98_07290 [Candidatus Polarisedimenticolia bacterium]|nr:hypothetical protein [Candidatus Polarisedimenticolia bacterium]
MDARPDLLGILVPGRRGGRSRLGLPGGQDDRGAILLSGLDGRAGERQQKDYNECGD